MNSYIHPVFYANKYSCFEILTSLNFRAILPILMSNKDPPMVLDPLRTDFRAFYGPV